MSAMNVKDDNKAVFAVLAVNHPGVLLRVAGLFSRRGFNIDSIVACTTENPAYSRLTLLVAGTRRPLPSSPASSSSWRIFSPSRCWSRRNAPTASCCW